MSALVVFTTSVVAGGTLGALLGALAGSRTGERYAKALLSRLNDIESAHVGRNLRFEELADQVERHLKRVQAIRQHKGNGADDLTQAVIDRKLANLRGD